MNNTLIISIIVGFILLLALAMRVATARYKEEIVPNYRAMFLMGICFIPIGITDLAFLPLGIIFLLVGLRNKDKWGKETKWADFPPKLRKIKLIFAGGFIILALLTAVFLIFSRMQYK